MTTEKLQYVIEAKDYATKEFKKVGKGLNSLGQGAGKMAGTMKSAAIPILAVGTAAGLLGLKMVKSAGQLEQTSVAFETLLGSAEAARKEMNMIKREAAATPFEQADLMQYNIQLISAGENADKAMKVIKDLGNAVSAVGGGKAEMARMISNMQQIKNVGKATAMDIRQFGNAGINIYKLLADVTGKNVDEVKEMEISYDLLTRAFAKASEEGGLFHGAMEKQSKTLLGRWSTFKDNIDILMGTLGEKLLPIVGQLLDNVSWFVQQLNTLATGEGSQFFTNIYEKMKPLVDFMVSQFKPIWDELVDSWRQASPELKKLVEMALPGLVVMLTAVAGVIMVLLGIFTALISGLASAADRIMLFYAGIIEATTGFFELIKGIFTLNGEAIRHGWETMWRGIQNVMVNSIMVLVDFVKGFVKAITNWFSHLKDVLVGHSIVPDMVNAILNWVKKLVTTWVSYQVSLTKRIIKIVGAMARTVIGTISNMIGQIASLGGQLYRNLVSPFERAWNKIKEMADKIRHTVADAFNMDKRNSPSINDRLAELKTTIQDTLGSIQVPQYGAQIAGALAPQTTQNITFNNEINSELDIAKVNYQLGLALDNKGRF